MAVVLALIAGPMALWMATAAYAQGAGTVSGTVLDLNGKPYPDVTLYFTNLETNKPSQTTTDAKGHYAMAGVTGGKYNVDFKAKDKDGNEQLVFQAGLVITSGSSPTYDVNLKELQEQGKLGAIDAARKQAEAAKNF